MLSQMRPLCAVMTRYPWYQQYPLGSIGTRAQGVGVAGGGSNVSVCSVNCCCKFVMRVVAARGSVVIVAYMVDIVPTAWRLAVVAVARFVSAWAWVYSICSWTAAFACPVAANMWA